MPDRRDTEKVARVDEAYAVLAKRRRSGKQLAEFVEALFEHGAAEDIVVYSSEELIALTEATWKLCANRKKNSHLVQVFNPDFGKGADASGNVTVIDIINDNMPFLVDSVMGELQEAGADIRLVLHPVLDIVRDKKGKLTEHHGLAVRGEDVKGARESLIQVHVHRIDSRNERDDLTERLNSLLNEVRQAVVDWKQMLSRLADTIESYKKSPPPIPVDDLAEAIQFLEWLSDDNFTLLGMRDYAYTADTEAGVMRRMSETGLGILQDPDLLVLRRGTELVTMTPEIREFLMRPELLIITKANVRSRIHRRVHMDYIGVKLFDDAGNLSGELRIVGLFTSTAYTRSTRRIPYLRRKVDQIISRAGYEAASHSGKALLNVLESYPRDEIFQIDDDTLFANAIEVLELYERPRIRVLPRRDKFDRFVSALVFVPRDHYTTEVRYKIGEHLCEVYDGRMSAWNVAFLENGLARVHIIIGRFIGETPNPLREVVEAAIADIVRTWVDRFRNAVRNKHDPERAAELFGKYKDAFSQGYREIYTIKAAERDIEIIETLSKIRRTGVDFYRRPSDPAHRLGLKLYNVELSIPLSERVPMLEAMGFRVINERTHRIAPADGPGELYLHDMTLDRRGGAEIDFTPERDARLDRTLLAIWNGEAESDGYNALALNADLDWRDVAMLRALSRYLRQVRIPYSQGYMWGALNRYPRTACRLVELFYVRFDPDRQEKDRETAAEDIGQEIVLSLEEVSSLDDDRIIRRFLNLIGAILRTNFFQMDAHGSYKPTITFKIDPRQLDDIPDPKPFREISVYSPRVEGVHLRFGRVARGGLRWSDRQQDFRTEVLGLVKAQHVKNAVIVPVGSKGGFVPKFLPEGGTREEIFQEGTAAYKIFVSSLLDITDNLENGKIIPPYRVLRHDDDDPYLVVAADKGTATFSDTANGISDARNFWLSDAFASGGSAGYDHKKMGITARGAWEAVKRHFREMDVDIQTTPFTVAGVGDMSGDVFGNGMLLSPAIKLVAAFDHRDIFFDPDPDIKKSFAERQRIFNLGRSSWQDYKTKLISKGGGVFSRQLKSIPLSKEIQTVLGLDKAKATPNEVMQAILKASVDLFWFGGIGTYVRASDETDADADDRANDAIRVTATEFGCKVVGEGANLGMTQKARIEFDLKGGRCNSDAIDNSAGVNSSDVEVNIKIAFGAALSSGKLDIRKRNRLLVAMTDEVAELVLRNNYLQTLCLSLTERRGFEDFGFQRRLMQDLESRDLLDRAVEELPDDLALAERERAGQLLSRAELGVILAYAKITLFDELVQSSVPDDAYLGRELFRYFPVLMQDDFKDEIGSHRLRREIIATVLANSMINRGGSTLMIRIGDQTGASSGEIAQSFAAVRDAFGLTALNGEIDALDSRASGDVQLVLYGAVQNLVLDQVVWFLRNVNFRDGIAAVVDRFSSGLGELEGKLDKILPPAMLERFEEMAAEWIEAGVPKPLAVRLSRLPATMLVSDIILVSEETGRPLKEVAASYFRVASYFRIGRLDGLARSMDIRDYYDGLALDRARQILATAHRRITGDVLMVKGRGDALEKWLDVRRNEVHRANETVASITEGELTVSRFAVAASLLADLAGS